MCKIVRDRHNLTKAEWSPWYSHIFSELWYDMEAWVEPGHSHSLRFFSSEVQILKQPEGFRLGAEAVCGFGVPSPAEVDDYHVYASGTKPDWALTRSRTTHNYLMPAIWIQAHFREDFWAWTRQNGPISLRTPSLARTRVYQDGHHYASIKRVGLDRDAIIYAPPLLGKQLQRIADNMIGLRRRIHALRGSWYRPALGRWQSTPYSDPVRRQLLEGLQYCQRTPEGEHNRLNDIFKLHKMRGTSRNTLNDDFYEAVATLATAALPVHFAPVVVDPGLPPDPATVDFTMFQLTDLTDEAVGDMFPKKDGRPNELERDHASSYHDFGGLGARQATIMHAGLISGNASHTPMQDLECARIGFDTWALTAPVPLGMVTEFYRAWRMVRVSVERTALSADWHDFDFELPAYQDRMSFPVELDHFLDSQEYGDAASDVEESPDEDLPMAKMARLEAPEWTRYVNVGEVGDHQYFRGGDDDGAVEKSIWGLRWFADGTEVAVYDITGVVATLPADKTVMDILDPATAKNGIGLMIRDALPSPLKEQVEALEPIALVVLERRADEVYMKTGRDGRDRWIMLGPNVYDVTCEFFSTFNEHHVCG